MYFGPRKLLFSQINMHRNNRVLLVNEFANRSTCRDGCPPECERDALFSPPKLPSPPIPSHKKNMPTILMLVLFVLGVAFVYLCYLTIIRRNRTNLRNSIRRNSLPAEGSREVLVDENQGPLVDHPIWYIRTVGLQQSVIDSIPVFKYKRGDGLIEGSDCSVCLSEFEEDESLRLLPKCSHAFHITCIDTWLRSHKNCPLCRAPIVRETDTSTGTPPVDELESVLDISGTREDSSVDDQQESGVGEDGVSELRIGVENIGPSSNEEGKILEILKRGSDQFITKNNRVRVLSDLIDHRVRVEEELQPVRRSFSMDLASASMIYAAVAKIHPVKDEGCSNFQDVEVKKQTLDIVAAKQRKKNMSMHRSRKSFSFGRSLQSVPIRMKRSFSSSGKLSPHRHSRSQELVPTT